MTRYRIKNWDKYQHYKDRNPPWIKLHYEMLSSADWVTLDDASRVLAVAIMLLASRTEGYVPDDLAYVKRVAYLNSDPDLSPLIKCGFLEVLADASKLHTNVRPETETEAYSKEEETEEEFKPKSDPPASGTDTVVWDMPFQTVWHAYPGIGQNGVLSPAYKGSRKPAQEIFFKIMKQTKEVERETLIRAITNGCDRYAQFLKQSGYPCKHLSTWLNDRGWEDDYAITGHAYDPVQRGSGKGQKPSYSDSVFNAAGAAIDNIRSRDGG